MKIRLLFVAVLLLARPVSAEEASSVVPCSSISPNAVKAVPAPFDSYMRLVCFDASGQGLIPPDGTRWVADGLNFGLLAFDDRFGPNGPLNGGRQWYTSLTPRKISAANDAALRRVLTQTIRDSFTAGAEIIELDAATSAGQVKQEFFIIPADAVATHGIKLLMECHQFCEGGEKPWILGVVQ